MMNCPYCGKLTDPNLEICPHCGGHVPPKGITPPPRAAAAHAERETCPNCHALVQDGDIICIACGTNLLTGQKIISVGKREVAVAAPSHASRWIVIGVIAAILALLVGIFLFFLLTRDPVKQAIELSRVGKELEASTILEKYIVNHDKDPRAYFEMAKIQYRMGQYPAAVESFQKTFDLEPANKDAAWMAIIGLSQPSGGAGARDRQLTFLRRLVENDPRDVRAWRLTALLKAAAADQAGEAEALNHVLELAPGDPAATQELAIVKALQHDYVGAAKELNSVAVSAENQGILGLVADMQGNADEAITQFRAASAADSVIRNDVLTRLGVLTVAKGDFEAAKPLVNDASSGDKNNAVAQFFRAACLRVNGLLPEATAEYEAISQRPGPLASESLIRAADLYIDQGNTAKASEILDKAEKAGAVNAAAHTVRGRLLAATNQAEHAQEEFQKAIQLDPGYAPAHLEAGLLSAKTEAFGDAVASLEEYLKAVGEQREGSHAEEVQMLIDHLKQASGQPADAGRASS